MFTAESYSIVWTQHICLSTRQLLGAWAAVTLGLL